MRARLGCMLVAVALTTSCVTRTQGNAPASNASAAKVELDGASVQTTTDDAVRTFAVDSAHAFTRSGDIGVERIVARFPDRARALLELHWTGPSCDAVSRAVAKVCAPDERCESELTLAGECAERKDREGVEVHVRSAVIAALDAVDPRTLERLLTLGDGIQAEQQAALRERLAILRVRRGESRAALAEYERAITLAPEDRRPRLAFERALLLKQDGSDTECAKVLTELTASHDASVVRRARALQGVIAAEHGDLALSSTLLDAALNGAEDTWSGAASAHADRAVVLLRLQRDEEGLAELSLAGRLFERDGDALGLARTLLNEAAWQRARGHDADAAQVESRVEQMSIENGWSRADLAFELDGPRT